MSRTAIFFYRIGPYHYARLRAAAALLDITAIEYTTEDDFYAWDQVIGTDGFNRRVLFRNEKIEKQTSRRIFKAVHDALTECKPDVVAIAGWNSRPAMSALKWCGQNSRPAILMSETTEWDFPRRALRETIKRYVINQYSTAFVGGTKHRDYLEKLGFWQSRIFAGYDAIDNNYFSDAVGRLRESGNLANQNEFKYFLASARFVRSKNLVGLIKAYAKYYLKCRNAAWHLVVLGDGSLRSELTSLCAALGVEKVVHFPGFKQYCDLPGYYAFAGAFVHASISEPWGLVVNEAMACGLPVIVSDRCGCAADLVAEGKNGFTFNPDDVDYLATLLVTVSAPQFPLDSAGGESRRIISNFGVDSFAIGLKEAVGAALVVGNRASSFRYHPSFAAVSRWLGSPSAEAHPQRFDWRRDFLLFRYAERPVLAMPAFPRRFHAAAVERYKANTWRRIAFRGLLMTASRVGQAAILGSKMSVADQGKLGIDYESWRILISRRLNTNDLLLALLWPPQPERQRLYFHVFDSALKPIAFVKVARLPDDRERIKNEIDSSQQMRQMPGRLCYMPALIDSGEMAGQMYSIVEPLPRGADPPAWSEHYDPRPLLAEWTGGPRVISYSKLCELPWWGKYLAKLSDDGSIFHERLITELRKNGASVFRVHGDFGLGNIAKHKERYWLFDWECSDANAPILTDALGYFLSFWVGRAPQKPHLAVKRLKWYINNRSHSTFSTNDLMLALAYRHAMGFPDTEVYLSRWPAIFQL